MKGPTSKRTRNVVN